MQLDKAETIFLALWTQQSYIHLTEHIRQSGQIDLRNTLLHVCNSIPILRVPYSPVIRRPCLCLHRKEMGA